MVQYIRASIGTLASLGTLNVELIEIPTTAYLLQYSEQGCLGTCAFCPQSMLSSTSKEMLSRVSWPKVELSKLVNMIKEFNGFGRICIQSIIKRDFHLEVVEIVKLLRDEGIDVPVSTALTPVSREYLNVLKELGVDYLGIGFDAATPKLFKLVGKPLSWDAYMRFLNDSLEIFGEGKVYVHIIVGLGEGEVDLFNSMRHFYNLGAEVALFALTPIKGTFVEGWSRPSILTYRKAQLIRYLLSRGYDIDDYVKAGGTSLLLSRELINDVINNFNDYAEAFLTSGCPACNRPFYNEGVRGPHYNYPSIKFLMKNKDEVIRDLMELINVGHVF